MHNVQVRCQIQKNSPLLVKLSILHIHIHIHIRKKTVTLWLILAEKVTFGYHNNASRHKLRQCIPRDLLLWISAWFIMGVIISASLLMSQRFGVVSSSTTKDMIKILSYIHVWYMRIIQDISKQTGRWHKCRIDKCVKGRNEVNISIFGPVFEFWTPCSDHSFQEFVTLIRHVYLYTVL